VSRQRGDHLEMAQYGHQLQEFMKKKGINPFKVSKKRAEKKMIFLIYNLLSFLNFRGFRI
jgi:hypothetical protein